MVRKRGPRLTHDEQFAQGIQLMGGKIGIQIHFRRRTDSCIFTEPIG